MQTHPKNQATRKQRRGSLMNDHAQKYVPSSPNLSDSIHVPDQLDQIPHSALQGPYPGRCACKTLCKGACKCKSAGAGCNEACGCAATFECRNRLNGIAVSLGLPADTLVSPCFATYAAKKNFNFEELKLRIHKDRMTSSFEFDEVLSTWQAKQGQLQTPEEKREHANLLARYDFFGKVPERQYRSSFWTFCRCNGPGSQGGCWTETMHTTHCPTCKDCMDWRE